MSTIEILYAHNDTTLELAGLHRRETGAAINDATVEVVLTDRAGLAVPGAAWPLVLAAVPGSDGLYRALLPASLELVPDAPYTATLTVTVPGGLTAQWQVECVCRIRRE